MKLTHQNSASIEFPKPHAQPFHSPRFHHLKFRIIKRDYRKLLTIFKRSVCSRIYDIRHAYTIKTHLIHAI